MLTLKFTTESFTGYVILPTIMAEYDKEAGFCLAIAWLKWLAGFQAKIS